MASDSEKMKAKKKAMISQPMAGRTDAEIVEAREKARGCRIEHDAALAYGLEVIYGD